MDDAEERRRRREAWAERNLALQAAVMEDMASRAGDEPRRWLALGRQARSYLRHLATWPRGRGSIPAEQVLDRHRAQLEDWRRRAEARVEGLEAAERRAAEAGLGLRLAVIGKGGAGKTVISSTLARLLARQGRKVLAADLDVNPGLAYSIGLGDADVSLPAAVLEEDPGAAYGWQLRSGLLPREVVEHHTVTGPDGVRLTGLGKIGDADKIPAKRTVVALMQVLAGFGEPGWDVIGDLEAGPTTPFERYHAFADDVAVVVGPAWRSAMTARRLLPMVGEGRAATVLANRFADEPDHPGLAPRVRIPYDPDVAAAERQGLAPLDACPGSPAIRAIAQVLDRFVPEPSEVSA